MQVTFGGTAGSGVTVTSATQATVTTPAHAAGVVDVTVTTPGGSATAFNGFAFLAAPTLTSVSPVSGPTAGGHGGDPGRHRLPDRHAGVASAGCPPPVSR